jgi:hypothetical protein
MVYAFTAVLLMIAAGLVAFQIFFSRLRAPQPAVIPPSLMLSGRYRPMLRLLSGDDLEFVSANRAARRALRAERRRLFRSYLGCLVKDYSRIVAGLRLAMVQSGVDRPDLTRALAKNRVLFALALCRIEVHLAMHAAGIGKVDVSGLVDALDSLRSQLIAFSSPSVAVSA